MPPLPEQLPSTHLTQYQKQQPMAQLNPMPAMVMPSQQLTASSSYLATMTMTPLQSTMTQLSLLLMIPILPTTYPVTADTDNHQTSCPFKPSPTAETLTHNYPIAPSEL